MPALPPRTANEIIDGQLARVKGIDRIETYVALDIRKYESWFGNLAHL